MRKKKERTKGIQRGEKGEGAFLAKKTQTQRSERKNFQLKGSPRAEEKRLSHARRQRKEPKKGNRQVSSKKKGS